MVTIVVLVAVVLARQRQQSPGVNAPSKLDQAVGAAPGFRAHANPVYLPQQEVGAGFGGDDDAKDSLASSL